MTEDQAVRLLGEYADYLEEKIIRPAVQEVAHAVNTPPAKRPWEMLGEYLREAAVLVLIFVPVDLLIPRALNGPKPLSPFWAMVTIALSLAMLIGGMWCERRR